MSERRWIKFWPADWHGDKALRTCSIAARGLWMDLICIAHEGTPYGHVTINGRAATVRQIATIASIPEKEAAKLIGELEDAGVCSRAGDGMIFSRRMVRDNEASEQGRAWVSKRYTNKGKAPDPSSPPTRGAGSPPTTHEARSKKQETPSESCVSVLPLDAPEPFEAWWQEYPRKIGKDVARKAYDGARKRGASHADLLTGLRRQQWSADPQFIPHPSTWLNGGRWQDDPRAAAPPARGPQSKFDILADHYRTTPSEENAA